MVSDALGAEIDVAHLQEIDHEKGGNEVALAQKSLKSHSFSLVCARMPLDQWAFSLSALLQGVGPWCNPRVPTLRIDLLDPSPRYGTFPRV